MASRAAKEAVPSCLLQSTYLHMLPSVYRALAAGAWFCWPLLVASPTMSIKACMHAHIKLLALAHTLAHELLTCRCSHLQLLKPCW